MTALRPLFMLLLCAGTALCSGTQYRRVLYTDLGASYYHYSPGNDSTSFKGLSSCTFGVKHPLSSMGKMEGLADLHLPFGTYLKPGVLPSVDTIAELAQGSPLLLDVRKLYLSLYLPFADLTLGRQIISFGKGVLFSPIDVFSSVELTDLSFRRSGSNIVMAIVPFGDLSGMDLVTEPPLSEGVSSSALRAYTTLRGWDLSLAGIYRTDKNGSEYTYHESMTGFTFKGDLVVGLHGEMTARFSDNRSTARSWMTGIDYSVHNTVVLLAEFLYAEQDPLWGMHNGFGSVQYIMNDLMTLSASLVHNFDLSVSMGTLQYGYNIIQNIDLTLYVRGYRGSPMQDGDLGVRGEIIF